MEPNQEFQLFRWGKILGAYSLGIIFNYLILNLAFAQTSLVTSSAKSPVSMTFNWSGMDDSEWIKKVGHMLLQPLSKEEVDMSCKQLGVTDEIQTDFFNFNDIVTKRDFYGREASKAAEMETIHNSGAELSGKFEKQYDEANSQCLEVAKKLRLELGDKQDDFIEWIMERNYMRNVVIEASFKKDLKNEEKLTSETIQTIEGSPRFKAFKKNKITKFKLPDDANSYFSRHNLSLGNGWHTK